jgi:hypothetical protein
MIPDRYVLSGVPDDEDPSLRSTQAAEQQILAEWKQGESIVRLHVRPRPRWLPKFIYNQLLKRLLYISVQPFKEL